MYYFSYENFHRYILGYGESGYLAEIFVGLLNAPEILVINLKNWYLLKIRVSELPSPSVNDRLGLRYLNL